MGASRILEFFTPNAVISVKVEKNGLVLVFCNRVSFTQFKMPVDLSLNARSGDKKQNGDRQSKEIAHFIDFPRISTLFRCDWGELGVAWVDSNIKCCCIRYFGTTKCMT